MKTLTPYLLLFGSLMVLSTGAVTALLVLKPELFRPGGETPRVQAAPADSVQRAEVVGPAMRDSADVSPGARRDTISAVRGVHGKTGQAQDSVRLLAAELEHVRKQLEDRNRRPALPPPEAIAVEDSVKVRHYKSIAKVLEAMPAENAARILQGLPDDDVRVLLLNIKKRQAARILAAIEPSRASQLVR